MPKYDDEAINTARDYYNSEDADNFYFHVWGGEDLHVGIYKNDHESIFDASRRTVERMAERLETLSKDSKVLDIGGGYGGSMRHLARTVGCHCTVLNLSEVENERDRAMNKEQGLDALMDVVDGAFEQLAFPDNSFDVVWSQDAILHSAEREKVLTEVARVLKPGGEFVMTDPMAADSCPEGVLDPILERIHLSSLGTPDFYIRTAEKLGMKDCGFENHSDQLPRHYARVRAELTRMAPELKGKVSDAYIERMKTGLTNWVNGGNNGYLAWGIFLFRKQ
ncbi:methyltransferase domain-containing protein [Algiphilus sp. NNCM1]|uniref:methyltransferase domain-containing protein n=1 Tax=Algiphilus sp. TaxID=1872431 RepID=UPI001CA75B23|nr:methyltransferase domain-containing protein [Algiphilus sp.]MBY8964171.1 methyltransferase domain-containing protein [Algiphilus acroporae]MCI5062729.1 methyltransferase domain-containing protein [Algiphilus sp.]MCI5104691.1 methyltransferase domain-containing protein [Algiphilus sp.]